MSLNDGNRLPLSNQDASFRFFASQFELGRFRAMEKRDYFGAERIDLAQVHFTPELLTSIPAEVARHYRVLPVFAESPTSLSIAVEDPSDLDVVDGVYFALRRDLVLLAADSQQLSEFIDRLYGGNT
jgi:hypothetical protein